MLAAQQEARERAQQSQVQQQVKPKMLKRMSAAERGSPGNPPQDTSPKRSSPTGQKPQPKVTKSDKQESSKLPHKEVMMDTSNFDYPKQDWILRDWSTSLQPASVPTEESELLDEIGRQFMAISKEPSRRRTGAQAHGPNLKRLSTDHLPAGRGSIGKKKARNRAAHHSPSKLRSDDSTMSVDTMEMVQPLSRNEAKKHDGNVVTQQLEDATGVQVPDYPELFVTKGKTRTSIMGSESTFTPKTSPEHALEEPDGLVGPNVPPPPAVAFEGDSGSPEKAPPSPEKDLATEGPFTPASPQRSVLHTSLLLETMEEGEMETRIDGNGGSAVLLQTTMGEKETALVGYPTTLLPASELGEYEKAKMEEEKKEERFVATSINLSCLVCVFHN